MFQQAARMKQARKDAGLSQALVGDGRATPAIAVGCVARSEREERLLVAFRSLSTQAKGPLVELLEARARAR